MKMASHANQLLVARLVENPSKTNPILVQSFNVNRRKDVSHKELITGSNSVSEAYEISFVAFDGFTHENYL